MKYLTEQEEKKLLRTAREVKGKKAERDHLIMLCGFEQALRLSEIQLLDVGDLKGKDKLYVRPETTKGTKHYIDKEGQDKKKPVSRTIPLTKKFKTEVHEFIKAKFKNHESIEDASPLFISKKGNRLSRRAIQEVFEYWCMKAGITVYKKGRQQAAYTVHSMRHTCLKRKEQQGHALSRIQKFAGHASLGSTGVYTEASFEEMQEMVGVR